MTFDDVRGYRVVVRVDLTTEGPPRVTEMTFTALDGAVSPRDVRRLPLGEVVTGAIQAVAIHDDPSLDARSKLSRTAMRIAMPRGRPKRGRSTKWYLDLLETYRELEARGIRPVPVIAKRKGADPNTVHQWIYRARKIDRQRKGK